MAQNNKNKKSFWQRAFGPLDEPELIREQPETPPEPPQSAESVESVESAESAEIVEIAESAESAEIAESAAPPLEPEAAPFVVPLQQNININEDVIDRAARLAEEERRMRQQAELAMAAAEKAEAARERADKEAALQNAEIRAKALKQQSAAAQEAASLALSELSAAEQAYSEALKAAEDKRLEEKTLRENGEKQLAELLADNERRLNAANQRLAALAAAIKENRAAADAAMAAGRQEELALEDVEAQLRHLTNEGNEEIRRNLKKVDEIKAEIAVVEKQISVYEARLNSEQQSFDKTTADLAEIEQHRAAAAQRLEQMRQQEQQAAEQKQQRLAQLAQEQQAIIAEAESGLELLRIRAAENEKLSVDRHQEAQELDKQRQSAEQELRRLNREKDEAEQATKDKIAAIIARIDVAKQDVADKKALYQQAQKQVEAATAQLIKANALASSAKAKAKQAAAEEQDAMLAADMAQRLRSDAMAARGNADSSGSILLDKAESVLLSTIDSTTKLLDDKRALREAADQEAADLQEQAAEAAEQSNAAAAAANDMVVVWLAAEEHFVQTTGEVEQEKLAVEQQLELLSQDYQQRCEAAAEEVQRLKDAAAAALDAADSIARQWRDGAAALEEAERNIKELHTRCSGEQEELQQQLDEQLQKAAANRQREEEAFEQLEKDYDYLRSAHDQAALLLSDKLAECTQERERLRQLHEEKSREAEELEQLAADLELKYKEETVALQARAEQTEAQLKQWRDHAAAQVSSVEEMEKHYADACTDLETIEKSCAEALEAAQNKLNAELSPLTEANRQCEERSLLLAERLNGKRSRAEQAVRSAAEIFTERLAAANTVAIKLAENDIAAIKENALPIYAQYERQKDLLNRAETAYADQEAAAAALRAAEEKIDIDAEEKYRRLDESTAASLNELERKLREQIKQEDGRIKEALTAQQAQEEAQQRRAAAEQATEESAAVAAAAATETAERLRQLEEQYQEQAAQAAQGLPELQAEAEAASAAAEKQRHAMEESEQAYAAQAQVVEGKLQAETAAPQQFAERIELLKTQQQIELNQVRTRLAALEEKQAELQAAYNASSDYADKSDQSKAEVEQYLARLVAEQQQVVNSTQQQISALSTRLNILSSDAVQKEQLYRQTEQTLQDSSKLIAAAEKEYEDAQIGAAKALAELQSSQAAKETATALAQQASLARDNMDQSTAAILMKAAEGLFGAVENAAAAILEKQNQYDQAELDLSAAAAELERVRAEIGEAPALLERSRQEWQQAERAFLDYQQQATADIARIQAEQDAYIAEHRDDMSAAETAAATCRAEAAAARDGVEKLSRQLMELAAEISSVAGALQTAEIEAADAVAELEEQAASRQAALKREREEAQELAAQLSAQLREQRDLYQQLQNGAEQKNELWRQRDEEYQLYFATLTQERDQAMQQARDAEAAAQAAAQAAQQELAAAQEAENAAQIANEDIKRVLAEASALREKLSQECEEMRRNRERLLKSAAEEKLRLLGTKTIERINAEELSSTLLAECVQQRHITAQAAKQVKEVEADLQQAQEKLRNIHQESEKALDLVKSKTAILTGVE